MAASADLQRMKDVECWELNTKVFGNGIIIRQLESYISYNDLKRCRLLSKEVNQSILANSNFISRTVVHINKESIAKRNHFDKFGFNMKSVKLHSWFKSVKEGNAAYLDYVNTRGKEEVRATFTDLNRIDCLDGLKKSTFPSAWIHDMVLGATELKELAISTEQMGDIHQLPLSDRMSKEALSAKLESLKSLDLVVDQLFTFEYFQNFKKLEQLRLIDCTWYGSAQAMTIQLIQGNQESLVKLQLNLGKFSDFNALILLSLHFPKLRVIRFTGVKDYMESFSSFLGRHKKQLTSVSFNCDACISETLVAALNEIGTNLENLRIKWEPPMNNGEKLIEWEKFGKLRDMKLACRSPCKVSRSTFASLWERLPAGLARIKILTHLEPVDDFQSVIPEFSISSMNKLCNVTVLILGNVGNGFKCSMLRQIFQHMGQLIELELTNTGFRIFQNLSIKSIESTIFDSVTAIMGPTTYEDGFCGIVRSESGDIVEENFAKSIQNLKALKKLALGGFRLADSTLLNRFKFPDLRQLCIEDLGHGRITIDSFHALLEQNPILEMLELDLPPLDIRQSEELLALVRRKYPALVSCPMIGLKLAW